MPRYRFDNAYENVYEWSTYHECYMYIGNYRQFNIECRNQYRTKAKKVEQRRKQLAWII